jgi:hypothetical protein
MVEKNYVGINTKKLGQDSSVSIVTCYELDGQGIESR